MSDPEDQMTAEDWEDLAFAAMAMVRPLTDTGEAWQALAEKAWYRAKKLKEGVVVP